jgi:hypothetical protein
MARGAKKTAKGKAKAAKPRAQKKAAPKKKQKAPAKPRAKKTTTAPESTPTETATETSDAIPQAITADASTGAGRSLTARERALRSSPVLDMLEDEYPILALSRFLDSLKAEATPQQAQIALGAAQLILMPMAREHRGGNEVAEVIDLVLRHWDQFGERRRGYHANEFLKHAMLAVGFDRMRLQRLDEMLQPGTPPDVLFNLACAYAFARDKVMMLRTVQRALDAGASASQFRRDPDFAIYVNDLDLEMLLARAEVPIIPVNVEPHVVSVRSALDHLVSTLKEFGEPIELRPPVRLDAILDAERARKISLPNDYRALLTITNGMTLWEHAFFGAGDYREATPLALSAQRYLANSTGLEECVPLAQWGPATDWLLYDPRGRARGGRPGYLLRAEGHAEAIEDLSAALARIEHQARETLGTN